MNKSIFLSKNILKSSLIATALSISLSGCIVHVGGDHDIDWDDESGSSVSSVFGEASVSAGKSVGDVSSVNGGVELKDDVSAKQVDSVNGDVDIGNRVSVHSIDVVNGDIDIGEFFKAESNIESVNGDISIHKNGSISGSVITVNGDIDLKQTQINHDVQTTNGSLTLTAGTVVMGNVVYERANQRYWSRDNLPTLRIDKGSTVNGSIILYRPVNLELENSDLASNKT